MHSDQLSADLQNPSAIFIVQFNIFKKKKKKFCNVHIYEILKNKFLYSNYHFKCIGLFWIPTQKRQI